MAQLLIPTSLLVTKATCNAINLQLPKVTEIMRRPLYLSIDRVDLALEEPEEVPPMPTALREMLAAKKKDPSKQQKERDAIGRSMNYTVNALNITLKLRNHPHVLTLQVRDFKLFTCTPTGHPTEDLVGARVVNAAENRFFFGFFPPFSLCVCVSRIDCAPSETIFKAGSIGSVTLAIGEGNDRLVLVDGLPGKLNMTNAVSCDVGLPLKTMVQVVLGKLGISLDRATFLRHYQFIKDLSACLDRRMPLPPAPGSSTPNLEKAAALKLVREKSGSEKVEFDLRLEDWSVLAKDASGEAFGVRGENFRITGSPPRGVAGANGVVDVVRRHGCACPFHLSPRRAVLQHWRDVWCADATALPRHWGGWQGARVCPQEQRRRPCAGHGRVPFDHQTRRYVFVVFFFFVFLVFAHDFRSGR